MVILLLYMHACRYDFVHLTSMHHLEMKYAHNRSKNLEALFRFRV